MELVRGFEQQLKQRLQQKTTQHISEETQLSRSFKYFDLNNSGTVELREFKKVCDKLGVWMANEEDAQKVFEYYDEDKDGELDYNEFIGRIYQVKNNSRLQSSRKQNNASNQQGDYSVSLLTNSEAEEILNNLRNQMNKRGARGILGLGRAFRILDDNGNKRLDKDEFAKGMRDYGLQLSNEHTSKLYGFFDRNQDGVLDYDEFLVVLRGPMNSTRTKLVEQAYRKLDKDQNGRVEIQDLIDVYSVAKHPDFISGKKTKEDILKDFMFTFEQYSDIRGKRDGVITKLEFIDYYNFISASIDNEEYFQLMMNNCWRINEADNDTWTKKGWAGQDNHSNTNNHQKNANNLQTAYQTNVNKGKSNTTPFGTDVTKNNSQNNTQNNTQNNNKVSQQQVDVLMKRLRQKVASRGTNGIFSLGRLFRNMDDNNSKSLNKEEFNKAMNEFRMGFNTQDCLLVFVYFDKDSNNELSYDEFLRGIVGEMNPARTKVVRQAFNKLDADKSGVVELNDIKQFYNAKMHPDVKSGKKSEDEVLGEFLDTFEYHYSQSNQNGRDGKVNFDEFTEYYNNISCSIDNDEYFDLMIKNAWKLDGHNQTYGKGWANQL